MSSNLNELSYLFVLINIFLQAVQASFFSEVLILFLINDARFFWIYLNRNDFLKSLWCCWWTHWFLVLSTKLVISSSFRPRITTQFTCLPPYTGGSILDISDEHFWAQNLIYYTKTRTKCSPWRGYSPAEGLCQLPSSPVREHFILFKKYWSAEGWRLSEMQNFWMCRKI